MCALRIEEPRASYDQVSLFADITADVTFANPWLKRLWSFQRPKNVEGGRRAISLFCGGGGLDCGLALAGFKTVIASDLVPIFTSTVANNLPGTVALPADASKLTAESLAQLADLSNLDLVAAGPPCQAFSILGRRGALKDPRGQLALDYFRLVADLRPRAFLFENVPGLKSTNGGKDWERLLQIAHEKTGYTIFVGQLNAVQFGIPQSRERILIIGFRKKTKFEFPTKPTGKFAKGLLSDGRFTPSKWALEHVVDLPNHSIREHGERVRKRYAHVKPGQRDATDHTDRIDPERPSGTVLVGSGAGGGRPHIHPYEPRVITVREAARLQSFPDWWEFLGNSTAQYRQVGNAVPPLLAYEVGKCIRETLES
jgi:DNA (cytosine-5)-methyltransferase 1